MLRVTPDVNVLIEAAISRKGPASEIVAAWRSGHVSLVTCEEIVARYEEVLHRPHIRDVYRQITAQTIAASATALRHHAEAVTLSAVPSLIAEDPDDDVILACGVQGRADYIVSRDRHLLRLGEHEGIPIVTVEHLLPILRRGVRETPEVYGVTRASSAAAR